MNEKYDEIRKFNGSSVYRKMRNMTKYLKSFVFPHSRCFHRPFNDSVLCKSLQFTNSPQLPYISLEVFLCKFREDKWSIRIESDWFRSIPPIISIIWLWGIPTTRVQLPFPVATSTVINLCAMPRPWQHHDYCNPGKSISHGIVLWIRGGQIFGLKNYFNCVCAI